MTITIKDIEAIRHHLSELPHNQPTEVSKQEAIALLATELGAAERRGYRHDDLARVLSENGIAINTATLRGYLRRGRKNRKRSDGKAAATAASASTRAAQLLSSAQIPGSAGTGAASAIPGRSAPVGAQEATATPPKVGPDGRGPKDTTAGGR